MVLGPLDEVGHDQEVAGEPHLLDHVEFVGQPLAISREVDSLGQPAQRPELVEPGLRQVAQRLTLGPAFELGVAWQDRLARRRHVGAALGDHQRVVASLGNIREQAAHLGGGLEVVLRRQTTAVRVLDMRPLLDAEQHVVRLVHRLPGEVHVVGRDQRQVADIGQLDQRLLGPALRLLAMALQLDIEAVAEQTLQAVEQMLRGRRLAGRQQPAHAAAVAARDRDESRRRPFELGQRQSRHRTRLEFEMGAAHQPHQV